MRRVFIVGIGLSLAASSSLAFGAEPDSEANLKRDAACLERLVEAEPRARNRSGVLYERAVAALLTRRSVCEVAKIVDRLPKQ